MKKVKDFKLLVKLKHYTRLLWYQYLMLYKDERDSSKKLRKKIKFTSKKSVGMPWQWKLVSKVLTDEGLEAYIYTNQDNSNKILISISGSAGKKDWKNNIRRRRVKVGKFRYHRGYWGTVEPALDIIVPMLKEQNALKNEDAEIIIIGHSKGGGEAKQLCVELLKLKYPVSELVLIAPSNSINRKAMRYIEKRVPLVLYLTNNVDKVHCLPYMGYKQPKRRLHLMFNGSVYEGAPKAVIAGDNLIGLTLGVGQPGLEIAEDHFVHNYYKELNEEVIKLMRERQNA